jgi:hypothetical protein
MPAGVEAIKLILLLISYDESRADLFKKQGILPKLLYWGSLEYEGASYPAELWKALTKDGDGIEVDDEAINESVELLKE